jgi:hypothetical protein
MKRKVIIVLLGFFALVSANAKEFYPMSQQPDHLMFHVTPAFSLLDYRSSDGRSIPTPTVGLGVEYAHYFFRFIGVSIGAEVNSYNSLYFFLGRKDSLPLFDSWSSRNYLLRQQLHTKEYQSVSYLSVPVKVILRQAISPTINLNLSAGVAYNAYLTESKNIVAGNIYRQAFFGDINVNIDEFYPLNFGKFNDYINPSSQKQFTTTLTGIAQLGFSFHFNQRWVMHTNFNFQYGLNNIKTRNINLLVPNEYAGITATNYIGNIKPYSLGFRIGVSYNFDLFDVDCHCTGKWWK